MKTTEANKTVVQTPGPTIGDLINKAKLTSPDGGEINLDEIEKSLKLSRAETVELCRNTVGATFKPGRKGNSSVLLYGQKAKEFIEERNSRNKVSKATVKRHYNKTAPATQEIIQESFQSPILRIRLGGEIKDIPIELSLVAA